MGKIVEKRRKKKKGRPSLLDLQKRTLKQQQQLTNNRNVSKSNSSSIKNTKTTTTPLNSSINYKSATHSLLRRRSTRRNPSTPSGSEEEEEEDEEEEKDAVELSNGKKRREKKLNLVLKVPSPQKSDADSECDGSQDDGDAAAEDKKKKTTPFNRKRKIGSIGGDGSVSEKEDKKAVSGANSTNNNVEDLGPSTPLPDKKLLLFILDRLQKKDTYGVFSEPVDPEELPEYHEVIEHPMDFGTVKKKLSGGAYTNLEQFEKDVFLICSNAMQYNAPDTIYFRQARSIQELAKKNFQNLRQDSDDNEPEPTVVRRGRPPTKNLKKSPGRPLLDRSGSEYSLDGTLAARAESINDLRKGLHVSDKSGFAESAGRSNGSRNDAYWLADNKFERNDEASGTVLKGNSVKYGKRQFVLDENRRNTYQQLSAGGRGSSVLTTFDSQRKQLMAVGLLSEHGYARSLARFAANMGTVAWKIASKRIERSLPQGIKFGPGWVGENDIPLQRAWILSSSPTFPVNTAVASSIAELKEQLSQKPKNNMAENDTSSTRSASEKNLSNTLSPSASSSTSPVAGSKSEPSKEMADAVERLNSHDTVNVLNNNASMLRPRPPFQTHQIHLGMNGLNGSYGFNLAAQMGKIVGAARSSGFNAQTSQIIDRISKTNSDFVHPATANSLTSDDQKLSEHSSVINSTGALPSSRDEEMEVPRSEPERRPSWPGSSPQMKSDSGLSPQQKSDSVPPDLNVRFQSPGSPSSTRVDSAQPDLALQL